MVTLYVNVKYIKGFLLEKKWKNGEMRKEKDWEKMIKREGEKWILCLIIEILWLYSYLCTSISESIEMLWNKFTYTYVVNHLKTKSVLKSFKLNSYKYEHFFFVLLSFKIKIWNIFHKKNYISFFSFFFPFFNKCEK